MNQVVLHNKCNKTDFISPQDLRHCCQLKSKYSKIKIIDTDYKDNLEQIQKLIYLKANEPAKNYITRKLYYGLTNLFVLKT